MTDYRKHISINSQIRFGRPVINGTRISVYDVLLWLSQGMSQEEILSDFPELRQEHILACLAYAAEREHRIRVA